MINRYFTTFYCIPLQVELQQMHYIMHAPIPGDLFVRASNILNKSDNIIAIDDSNDDTVRYFINSESNLVNHRPLKKYKVTKARAEKFYGCLNGTLLPSSDGGKKKDSTYRSWELAQYECCTLNMVEIKKIKKLPAERYNGECSRGRQTLKTTNNPNGFTNDDYYICCCCTCKEFERTSRVCTDILVVLHDMNKLNVDRECAQLLCKKKPGRHAFRGKALQRDAPHNPLTYPAGIVGKYCKISNRGGRGLITGVIIKLIFWISIDLTTMNHHHYINAIFVVLLFTQFFFWIDLLHFFPCS